MNKLVMLLVTLMVTLFGANAMAFNPPDAPAKGWYVVDKAGKLSQSEMARLNQKIEQVSRTTKNEFGVLVLDTMDGGNIEDAAYDTFKKWGVGKHGLDNGVLVVISVKERKSRIETGKGVGGEVPDLKAKDILDKNLAPHLKRGDFYGGLDETLNALSSLIESRHNEKVTPRPTPVATPTYTSAPATTSNPIGATPPTSTPRTNSGGCQTAPVGASTDGDGFFVMVGGLGLIFLGGWLMARRARNKKKAEAEARAREEQARQARILAARKLQEQLEAAAKERDRILSIPIPTPAVAVPSIRPAPPTASYIKPTARTLFVPPTPPVRHVAAPLPAPIPRPLPKVDPRPTVSAPTTVVAAGEAIAAAAATALRKKQEEVAAEARRVQEAGEDNRRRQARREAEAEEERQADARREARRQEERYEEERRAQARRDEEDRAEARRRDEEDDRRRREEESRSSYSSSDSGSSDSDSGGGFGGGDSGGGGASSDW